MGSGTRLCCGLLAGCLAVLPCAASPGLAIAGQSGGGGKPKPVRLLELRGQVLTARGEALRSHFVIWVNLQGATTPFNTRTRALGGKFKFTKLLPGSYTLTAQVRGEGEVHQTIEVTPALADSKDRVTVKVIPRPSPEEAQARQTVSARALSISGAAIDDYRKAQRALERRDADAAIKHLEKAIEHSPAFVEAINLMGTIYYQRRDLKKAEQVFRQALAIDPQAYEPLVNLGGTLLDLRRYQEALDYNVASAGRRPEDALAHAQLGMNLAALGRYDDAIESLKKAKQLDPAHFSLPQISLYHIYRRKGQMQLATAELEEFMRLHPDDPLAVKLREELKKVSKQ
jgi:Tfp pilus assembly protein PilF